MAFVFLLACGSPLASYVQRADDHLQKNNLKDAARVYHEAIKKFPNEPLLYLNQGAIFRKQQKYSRAIKNYDIVQTLNPKSPHPYFGRAKVYMAQSALVEARKEIENLLRIDPEQAEAFYYMGRISYQAKEGYQAETYLGAALSMGFDEDKIVLLRGKVYDELLKNTAKARADFQRYIELGGSRAEVIQKRLAEMGM